MFRIAKPSGFADALTPEDLPLVAEASGVAVVLHDGVRRLGTTPSDAGLHAIAKWLQRRGHDAYATDCFSDDARDALAGEEGPALLAVAIQRDLGEYVLWFRPTVREDSASWAAGAVEAASGVRATLLAKARRYALTEIDRVFDEQRKVDEFFAAVGHELRNSTSVVSGWVTLLKSNPDNLEQRRRGLDTIERNVRVQGKLVDDLVEASKLARGTLELELAEIDILALVEDVLTACLPALESKQLNLERVLGRDLGTTRGDAERLRQVFANILGNAVKFTASGGTIRLQARRAESRVEIGITDTGVGISKEFLPHVFEAFRQAGPARPRERSAGLGLGLAIARRLVELHGGELVAESPGAGLGSTFRVSLLRTPSE